MGLSYSLSVQGDFRGGRSSYQLVGTHGKTLIHAEHPAVRVQSNGVVTTTVNTPDSSPNNSRKEGVVLVQSQLKGVNKVILSEGVAIPARSEMIITGKIQAKDVSQVGMIAACHSESVRHLKGLHVARLVVTPVDKAVPIRIANTTATAVELATGCKLAEFWPLIEQENVAANNVSVDCNAVKADNITHKLDSSLDPVSLSQYSPGLNVPLLVCACARKRCCMSTNFVVSVLPSLLSLFEQFSSLANTLDTISILLKSLQYGDTTRA